MHELGIAQSILAAVQKETAKYPGARALKVGVLIGPMAGVNRESLTFCFQIAAGQEGNSDLELDVQDGKADELDLKYVELEEP
jgi:Zn finger protein HypA/HybF involved in hydrogenase expression